MDKFFAELKRRHVYRVGAAYAVVAWVLIQLVNNVSPLMRLPEWAGSFFLVILLAGFPVALLFAWIRSNSRLRRPTGRRRLRTTLGWISCSPARSSS